jgi:molybdopterin-containing oxidoreductase family membrane subunit
MKPVTRILLWLLWLIAAGLGVHGLLTRLLDGHIHANYGSYIVWGLWVAAYIYFVGLSAGSYLFSSMIYVFGVRRLEKVGRLALFTAIVTLGMGLTFVWFDLGQMFRAWRIFTSPNFGSMMAYMAWLYSFYALVLLVQLWLAMRADFCRWQIEPGFRGRVGRWLAFHKGPLSAEEEARCRHWLKVLAIVGVPLAVAFSGGVGALFGTLSARPFWHTPLMPILFLTGALISGGALMAFVVAAFYPHRDEEYRQMIRYIGRAVLGLLVLGIVIEWAEFSVPMWYGVGHEYELLMRVLFGPFWWVFWIVHVVLGCVIPGLLLTFRGDRPRAVGWAGFLVALTFMAVRLNIVIPGLLDPHLQGLQDAFTDRRLVFWYVPSFFEWQVVFFVVAMGCALFYLGYRFLPLLPKEPSVQPSST